MTVSKLRSNELWKLNTEATHSKLLQRILKEIPLFEAPTTEVHVNMSNVSYPTIRRIKRQYWCLDVRIYAVGYKIQNGTGAGVFSNDSNIYINYSGQAKHNFPSKMCWHN